MTAPDSSESTVNDPPVPALPDVEQRPVNYPAIPVQVVGPVLVQQQPARQGQTNLEHLSQTVPLQVLSPDPRRQRAILVSGTAWSMSNKRSGAQAPIPANVPIELHHASEVWALGTTGEQSLTVIIETYAQ